MDTIGIVCEADHPVFGRAAERLATRRFGVEFFPPGEPFGAEALDGLDALANTTLSPWSFAALRHADRAGGGDLERVRTDDDALLSPPRAARARTLGCHVPATGTAESQPRHRQAGPVSLGPTTSFAGGRPPRSVRTEPVTYRYYAVDDGVETHVHAMVVRSEWTATGRPPRRPTSTSNWPPASASCSTGSGRTVAVDFCRDARGVLRRRRRPGPGLLRHRPGPPSRGLVRFPGNYWCLTPPSKDSTGNEAPCP